MRILKLYYLHKIVKIYRWRWFYKRTSIPYTTYRKMFPRKCICIILLYRESVVLIGSWLNNFHTHIHIDYVHTYTHTFVHTISFVFLCKISHLVKNPKNFVRHYTLLIIYIILFIYIIYIKQNYITLNICNSLKYDLYLHLFLLLNKNVFFLKKKTLLIHTRIHIII